MLVALVVLVYHGHGSVESSNVQSLIENPSLCECFTVICLFSGESKSEWKGAWQMTSIGVSQHPNVAGL